MSDQADAPANSEDRPTREYLALAYEQVHDRYAGITEFRAKLLGLLPLATGAGTFLLLQRAQDQSDRLQGFLGPIGIFGLVVTLGLLVYELRGMQRCQKLEEQGTNLEKKMDLAETLGPFRGQPPRRFGGMVGAPAAGLIIYIATAFAWLCLAGYGFEWSLSMTWGFVGFAVVLAVSLILLWLSLRPKASTKPSSSDPL